MSSTTARPSHTEEDPVALASALVDHIRPGLLASSDAARQVILDITRSLETDPALRSSYRRALFAIIGERRQVSLYSDTGILPNTGFFTECFRRVTETILPGTNDA